MAMDPLRQAHRPAALGNVPAAEAEQARFREAAKLVPRSRQIHNVLCVQLLAIAEETLEGEIAYRRGMFDAAFARWRTTRWVRCCWNRAARQRLR